jgi:hypothetical protein
MNKYEQHFFEEMRSIAKCLGHVYRADNPKLEKDSAEFALRYLKKMNSMGFTDLEACAALGMLAGTCAEVNNLEEARTLGAQINNEATNT